MARGSARDNAKNNAGRGRPSPSRRVAPRGRFQIKTGNNRAKYYSRSRRCEVAVLPGGSDRVQPPPSVTVGAAPAPSCAPSSSAGAAVAEGSVAPLPAAPYRDGREEADPARGEGSARRLASWHDGCTASPPAPRPLHERLASRARFGAYLSAAGASAPPAAACVCTRPGSAPPLGARSATPEALGPSGGWSHSLQTAKHLAVQGGEESQRRCDRRRAAHEAPASLQAAEAVLEGA